jgi:uncharacterized protein YcbX
MDIEKVSSSIPNVWVYLLTTRQLYIYPIKSLLPIEVDEATITECGLQYDRQYVLVHFPEEKAGELKVLTIKTRSDVCIWWTCTTAAKY